MKKSTTPTKAPQRTLTQQDLAAVRGGHKGTIIVESASPQGGGAGGGETQDTGQWAP